MRLLDLDYAASGYLPLPDGRPRWVWGLDAIILMARRLGVRILWADLPGAQPACSHRPTRTIYLAPWLGLARPIVVKAVLLHELLHIQVGSDEEHVAAVATAYGADLGDIAAL